MLHFIVWSSTSPRQVSLGTTQNWHRNNNSIPRLPTNQRRAGRIGTRRYIPWEQMGLLPASLGQCMPSRERSAWEIYCFSWLSRIRARVRTLIYRGLTGGQCHTDRDVRHMLHALFLFDKHESIHDTALDMSLGTGRYTYPVFVQLTGEESTRAYLAVICLNASKAFLYLIHLCWHLMNRLSEWWREYVTQRHWPASGQ